MTTLSELLLKKPAAQPESDPAPKLDNPNRVLHGTGLHKRDLLRKSDEEYIALRQAEARENVQQITLNRIDVSAGELHAALHQTLPDNLIPQGIEYDESQLAALAGLRKQKYGCLIGAAGTGKTTTVKQLIRELEEQYGSITDKSSLVSACFSSFTGRAVQMLKRALPESYHPLASTIHALLGYMPMEEEFFDEKLQEYRSRRVFRPTFTAANKLPYRIFIVDEAGTVPIHLWNELLAASVEDARFILIGDINQLPPVSGRSVLGFAMINWPTYALEKIHRQAADNPIIANAHRVLHGELPQADAAKFAMMTLPDGSSGAKQKTLQTIQYLHKNGVFDPMRDALIVPQNKSAIGQIELNMELVRYFNPPEKSPRFIIKAGYIHVTFSIGDKVMLLANNNELGLTNGQIGVVTDIVANANFKGETVGGDIAGFDGEIDMNDFDAVVDDAVEDTEEENESLRQASHIMKVRFQNYHEDVNFTTAGDFKRIAHAYAFTCHKSQGGEYENVVILLHSANHIMLCREWLYTAITRAKNKVILLHNRRGLITAINTQRIKGKNIAEKARAFLALQDKADTALPNLPQPEEI